MQCSTEYKLGGGGSAGVASRGLGYLRCVEVWRIDWVFFGWSPDLERDFGSAGSSTSRCGMPIHGCGPSLAGTLAELWLQDASDDPARFLLLFLRFRLLSRLSNRATEQSSNRAIEQSSIEQSNSCAAQPTLDGPIPTRTLLYFGVDSVFRTDVQMYRMQNLDSSALPDATLARASPRGACASVGSPAQQHQFLASLDKVPAPSCLFQPWGPINSHRTWRGTFGMCCSRFTICDARLGPVGDRVFVLARRVLLCNYGRVDIGSLFPALAAAWLARRMATQAWNWTSVLAPQRDERRPSSWDSERSPATASFSLPIFPLLSCSKLSLSAVAGNVLPLVDLIRGSRSTTLGPCSDFNLGLSGRDAETWT